MFSKKNVVIEIKGCFPENELNFMAYRNLFAYLIKNKFYETTPQNIYNRRFSNGNRLFNERRNC